MSKWIGVLSAFVCTSSMVAHADSKIAIVVDVDKEPALTRIQGSLASVFCDEVRRVNGVIAICRPELERVGFQAPENLRDSDTEAVALAASADATYVLHVFVSLDPVKAPSSAKGPGAVHLALQLKARVVRRDGATMVSGLEVSTPIATPKREAVLKARYGELTKKLVKELDLSSLAAQVPVRPAPPAVAAATEKAGSAGPIGSAGTAGGPVVDGADGRPSTLPLPPLAPPLVDARADAGKFPYRPVGYAALGVGAAAAIAGILTFALAPSIGQDAAGNLEPTDASKVRAVYGQQSAGVGLIAAGGLVAAAGGALLLFAPAPVSELKLGCAPTEGGARVLLGGNF